MAKKNQEYHPQTQEDLENIPPMSKTQKAILGVAAVGIIGFITYVVVF